MFASASVGKRQSNQLQIALWEKFLLVGADVGEEEAIKQSSVKRSAFVEKSCRHVTGAVVEPPNQPLGPHKRQLDGSSAMSRRTPESEIFYVSFTPHSALVLRSS